MSGQRLAAPRVAAARPATARPAAAAVTTQRIKPVTKKVAAPTKGGTQRIKSAPASPAPAQSGGGTKTVGRGARAVGWGGVGGHVG